MKQLGKNWLELSVFGASSVIVLATIWFVVYDALFFRELPTIVEVILGPAEPRGESFAVPVAVMNQGDVSAETVLVRVELRSGRDGTEESDLEIPMLPGKAMRRGWVMFSGDPAGGELSARVMGYHSP